MNRDRLIIAELIEEACEVKIAEGGFSLHDNNETIGMNIYNENGCERDFFIAVSFYLELLEKKLKE